MRMVIIAMLPAFAGSVWFFGWRALMLVGLSVASAIVFDALSQKLFGRKVTITDGSAVITGMLLAFNLPPGEALTVVATPDFARPTVPYATYLPPAAYESGQAGQFWVTRPRLFLYQLDTAGAPQAR